MKAVVDVVATVAVAIAKVERQVGDSDIVAAEKKVGDYDDGDGDYG